MSTSYKVQRIAFSLLQKNNNTISILEAREFFPYSKSPINK